MGYHTERDRWEIVLGTSSTEFDWAGAREIDLSSLLGVSGKWFSGDYAIDSGVGLNVPFISSMEILEVDGKSSLFLFYTAGPINENAYAGATARGYGAVKIPLFD